MCAGRGGMARASKPEAASVQDPNVASRSRERAHVRARGLADPLAILPELLPLLHRHLMTFLQVRQPSLLMKGMVLLAQGGERRLLAAAAPGRT